MNYSSFKEAWHTWVTVVSQLCYSESVAAMEWPGLNPSVYSKNWPPGSSKLKHHTNITTLEA